MGSSVRSVLHRTSVDYIESELFALLPHTLINFVLQNSKKHVPPTHALKFQMQR